MSDIKPIGYRRDGSPVWPIMGGDGSLDERIDQLKATAEKISTQLTEAAESGEGFAETKDELAKVKADLAPLMEAKARESRDSELRAEIDGLKELLSQTRSASKANLLGGGRTFQPDDNFFTAVAMAQNPKVFGATASEQGKATLAEWGSQWSDPDPAAKATVGDSDAAGGYLVPNPVVSAINLQATPQRQVIDLFNVISGVRGSAVDIPWEQEIVTRATIALPGATKNNANFIVNNYTATLYTLARIFDVGNQLLRQSQGAAEQLVRSKLARAFALGEDYYALSGSGTNEPYGLLTALGTSGAWVTSFTPSATTLAGSAATAIATLAGVVANRGAEPNGAVMNSADYWTMLAQGTDAAGFFFAPSEGPNAINGGGLVSPFGVPIRHSPNMTQDNLVVGDFKSTNFFRGDGYRVDTSSEAGTRWDTNLTGFRGEEEIAFDARPTVYTGHFQRITNLVA